MHATPLSRVSSVSIVNHFDNNIFHHQLFHFHVPHYGSNDIQLHGRIWIRDWREWMRNYDSKHMYMLNLFDKKIYICLENIYRLYFQLDEHFNIVKYRFLEKFCINMHSYVFKNSIKKKETRKLMFVQFFFFFRSWILWRFSNNNVSYERLIFIHAILTNLQLL